MKKFHQTCKSYCVGKALQALHMRVSYVLGETDSWGSNCWVLDYREIVEFITVSLISLKTKRIINKL